MALSDLKILLIQIRPDEMKDHEFSMFVKYSGLAPEQFRRLDIFKSKPDFSVLDGADAVVVGGSGDYLLSRGDIPAETENISGLLVEARRRGLPILGICFGAQLITAAFGGSVYHDEINAEMGTFEVEKTPAAASCPLFSDLPEIFPAELGHQDHLGDLPSGAIVLAKSHRTPVQALTFPGEPIYAVVFHPELDVEAMTHRIRYYAGEYSLNAQMVEEMRSRLRPAPEASLVLSRFFERVVMGGKRYPKGA